MKSYTQLTCEQRYQISGLKKADLCGFVIDETISHSTKPASWQVAGYPAQAGIRYIKALDLRLCGDDE